MWAKVKAFHMRRERRILSIKWNDLIPNVTVAATSSLDSIINIACARQLGLFGHVARFSRDVPVSNILSICCTSGDGYPQPFLDALEWTSWNHLAWSHLFWHWHCLWWIHFLWHKIAVEGGRHGRKGYAYLTNWLTPPYRNLLALVETTWA